MEPRFNIIIFKPATLSGKVPIISEIDSGLNSRKRGKETETCDI